jgi:hypothetical protein
MNRSYQVIVNENQTLRRARRSSRRCSHTTSVWKRKQSSTTTPTGWSSPMIRTSHLSTRLKRHWSMGTPNSSRHLQRQSNILVRTCELILLKGNTSMTQITSLVFRLPPTSSSDSISTRKVSSIAYDYTTFTSDTCKL